MSPIASQREAAALLRSLQRPPELIAVNTGLSIDAIRAWLKSGNWPRSTHRTLFDAGASPRETTKPTDTVEGVSGLRLFARIN